MSTKIDLATQTTGNLPISELPKASANSVLVGSSATGSGAPYSEITLGTNLSMAGSTLNASGGGGGGGSVTSIATTLPITGGTITTTGTIGVNSATDTALGVVQPDGTTTVTDTSGILSAIPGTSPNYPTNALISGGGVAWVSGYTYTVSAAVYAINGQRYTSAQANVTLGAPDPTNDRIDIIIVDTSGTVSVIAGTPAPSPLAPAADPSTQLEITFVDVQAGSSAPPGVSTTIIYDENTEWTTSGSASWNFTDTSHPYHGTKDISVTSAASGDFGQFQNSTTVTLPDFNTLVFYIESKAAWPKNKSLQLQFQNAGTKVGNTVTLKDGSFGFTSSNITTYQQIVIPISLFATAGVANQLHIAVNGSGANIGFYLDFIQLQVNGSSGGGSTGTVTSVTGATSGGFVISTINPTTTPVVSAAVDGTHYLPTTTDQSNWNAKLGPTLSSSQVPLLSFGFILNTGATGTNVASELAALRAGSFTVCKFVTKTSDGATALTFTVKQNGTGITTQTIAAGTSPGTVSSFTITTTSVAVNDVFTLDITSGSSNWSGTVQVG